MRYWTLTPDSVLWIIFEERLCLLLVQSVLTPFGDGWVPLWDWFVLPHFGIVWLLLKSV